MPLQVLVDKFSHTRFEPSGMTKNAEVRFAKSIVDYIFRWMATKFLSAEAQWDAGVNIADPHDYTLPAPAAVPAPPRGVIGGGKGRAPTQAPRSRARKTRPRAPRAGRS